MLRDDTDRPLVLSDIRKRYMAGIEAVEQGADPYEMFWLVLFPSKAVRDASQGKLPQGYRERSEEEVRALRNERLRRYAQPAQKRWAA